MQLTPDKKLQGKCRKVLVMEFELSGDGLSRVLVIESKITVNA